MDCGADSEGLVEENIDRRCTVWTACIKANVPPREVDPHPPSRGVCHGELIGNVGGREVSRRPGEGLHEADDRQVGEVAEKPFEVTDRAHSADPEKRSLLSAAKKVTQLTPVIGVEIEGIDPTQLSDGQKDELYVVSYKQVPLGLRS